jgi:hypothetical protein
MDDIFLSTELGNGRVLCISALSAKTYKEAGGKGLGGDYGYFVYEVDATAPQAGIEVIAKAASVNAAMRLYEIIAGAYRTNRSAAQYITG